MKYTQLTSILNDFRSLKTSRAISSRSKLMRQSAAAVLLSLPFFAPLSSAQSEAKIDAPDQLVATAASAIDGARALPTDADPRAIIQTAVDDIVAAIEEAKVYFDEEPERFHAEIDNILLPIVDFRSFARNVMGKYGSSKYQASLKDEQQRAEFDARIDRFAGRFKQGLVATYAKGLLAFEGERIEVEQLADKGKSSGSVTVMQNIYTTGSDAIKITYKMRKNKEQHWKVRNVHLQSINLGKVYRNQFASAARQYNGDIDKVIDNWVVESQDFE